MYTKHISHTDRFFEDKPIEWLNFEGGNTNIELELRDGDPFKCGKQWGEGNYTRNGHLLSDAKENGRERGSIDRTEKIR